MEKDDLDRVVKRWLNTSCITALIKAELKCLHKHDKVYVMAAQNATSIILHDKTVDSVLKRLKNYDIICGPVNKYDNHLATLFVNVKEATMTLDGSHRFGTESSLKNWW